MSELDDVILMNKLNQDLEESGAYTRQCERVLEAIECARQSAYDALVAADYPVGPSVRRVNFKGDLRPVWDLKVWSECPIRVFLSSTGELLREHNGGFVLYNKRGDGDDDALRIASWDHSEVLRRLNLFADYLKKGLVW